jgi:hypothetical protein
MQSEIWQADNAGEAGPFQASAVEALRYGAL